MSAADCGWRALEHTADEGFELWAPSYEGLLAQGGLALFAVIGESRPGAAPLPLAVECEGIDREDLLVRLLHALLVRFTLDGLYLEEVAALRVSGDADALWRARLEGRARRVDRAAEELVEVKAVTYHGLYVREDAGRWEARVILDL